MVAWVTKSSTQNFLADLSNSPFLVALKTNMSFAFNELPFSAFPVWALSLILIAGLCGLAAKQSATTTDPQPTKKAFSGTANQKTSSKKKTFKQRPAKKRKLGPASLTDILGFNPTEKQKRTDLNEDEIPKKWKKYNTWIIYQNRLRHEHYKNMFIETGFEIIEEEAKNFSDLPNNVVSKLLTGNESDLATTGRWVIRA